MVKTRLPRALLFLSGLLLLGAALRYGLTPIGGFDIFWHLKTGERMLSTWSLLSVDPFAYTLKGQPWPYKDAGAALVLHLIHSWFGAPGLVWFKALVFVATLAALAHGLVRVRQVPPVLAIALVAVSIEATAFRFHERPQTMAFLLTMLAVVLLDSHHRSKTPLWPLVPLAWVLANLHRGALVLPLLAASYWLCRLWQARSGEPVSLRRLGSVVAATAVACLLTPQGTHILTSSLTMLGESGYRGMIPEWYPSTPGRVWDASPASFVMLALLLVGLFARGRRQDPWDLTLSLLAIVIAANGVRFLPYLCLLGAGPAASGLARFDRVFAGRLAPTLGVVVAALALFYATLSELPKPRVGWQAHRYPERALDFVRKQNVKGHVLNSFRHGGYLIFHAFGEYPVYVDGRNDIAYPLDFLTRAVRALDNPNVFSKEQKRWNVQWLFITNEPNARTRVHLDTRPDWSLVFVSEAALVYVKNDGPNRRIAARHAYRYLKPHALDTTLRHAFASDDPRLRQHALREAERMVREDPESYPANVALALAYQLSGATQAIAAKTQWQRVRALEAVR